jgi:hypothetical protein
MTQREDDIAQLEAKMRAEKLFKEWRDGYMGERGELEGTEDSVGPAAEDFGNPSPPAY